MTLLGCVLRLTVFKYVWYIGHSTGYKCCKWMRILWRAEYPPRSIVIQYEQIEQIKFWPILAWHFLRNDSTRNSMSVGTSWVSSLPIFGSRDPDPKVRAKSHQLSHNQPPHPKRMPPIQAPRSRNVKRSSLWISIGFSSCFSPWNSSGTKTNGEFTHISHVEPFLQTHHIYHCHCQFSVLSGASGRS